MLGICWTIWAKSWQTWRTARRRLWMSWWTRPLDILYFLDTVLLFRGLQLERQNKNQVSLLYFYRSKESKTRFWQPGIVQDSMVQVLELGGLVDEEDHLDKVQVE